MAMARGPPLHRRPHPTWDCCLVASPTTSARTTCRCGGTAAPLPSWVRRSRPVGPSGSVERVAARELAAAAHLGSGTAVAMGRRLAAVGSELGDGAGLPAEGRFSVPRPRGGLWGSSGLYDAGGGVWIGRQVRAVGRSLASRPISKRSGGWPWCAAWRPWASSQTCRRSWATTCPGARSSSGKPQPRTGAMQQPASAAASARSSQCSSQQPAGAGAQMRN